MRRWLPLLLLAVGALRVASLWTVFTQTFDEPFHIACGMEWWEKKTYTRERQHPPLTRIAVAALPYWIGGAKEPGIEWAHVAGNEILGTGEQYTRRLALARAGNLPFYLLFCVAVWRWTLFRAGDRAALGALFVASTLPMAIGHGALATTDMAVAAMFAAFGWRFDVWQREQSWANAAWAGLALAGGLGSKISFLAFGPVLALLLIRRRPNWRHLTLIALLALLGLLSLYRFKKEYTWDRELHRKSTVSKILGLRAFLVPYLRGLEEVRRHNSEGHWTYLNGHTSQRGSWLFFPEGFALKTPIVVVLLFFAALFLRGARWAWVIGVVPLLMVMPANINLGLRHALPIYAGVCIAAGIVLARQPWIALWILWNTVQAHPDHAFWFNELARGKPERFLAESDLDWGQDLHRAVAAMDRRGIAKCRLAYFGTADVQKLFPGRFENFRYEEPAAGCTISSVRHFALDADLARKAGFDAPFAWIEKYPLTEQIGTSLRLYVIDKVN